jgi:hypothetical protein
MHFHIALQAAMLGADPHDGAQEVRTGLEIPGPRMVDGQHLSAAGGQLDRAETGVKPDTLKVTFGVGKPASGPGGLANGRRRARGG